MENRLDGFSLSPQQRRIWNLIHGAGPRSSCRTAGVLQIEGAGDQSAVVAAFREVVARYEILRTRFLEPVGAREPVQVIGATDQSVIEPEPEEHGVDAADLDRAAARLLHEGMAATFEPLRCPIDVKLARAGERRWLAAVRLSPLAGDARSIVNLAPLLATALAGNPVASDLPQYADIAGWLLETEERCATADDRYWQEQWRAAVAAPAPRTPERFEPRWARHPIPACIEPGDPKQRAVLFAAWVYILWRRHQERDGPVALALTSDGRPPELREALGVFGKHMPSAISVDPLAHFDDWSAECIRQWDAAQLRAAGCAVRCPLETRLAWAFGLDDRSAAAWAGGIKVSLLLDAAVSAKFDLALECVRRPHGWAWELAYNADLISTQQADDLLDALAAAVSRFSANPRLRLCDGPSMGERESVAVLARSSGEARPIRSPALLHDAIGDQMKGTPSAVALEFEGNSLTYAGLDVASGRIADRLLEMGAGPERIVAVWGERSLEFPVAMLATLRAGAAFLALDPELPLDRLAGMIEDARPVLLLAPAQAADRLAGLPCRIERYGLTGIGGPAARADAWKSVRVDAQNLAYCIYTSGSTGKPKGALITHRAIVNQMEWVQREWPLDATDRMLLKTSCGFDPSVWEVFWPLLHAASVVIAAPEGHKDTGYLCRLMAERHVTCTYFVPSMIAGLLADPAIAGVQSFKWIPGGGEAVPMDLIRAMYSTIPGDFVHLYGPAEAAIAVLGCVISHDETGSFADLGDPISNSSVFLLDEFMQLVPDGAIGEIYIGGVTLGRGYLNLPARTASTWVPDPFARQPGARLYRTGDLARRHLDGRIEFVGRADRQVKIRGSRVELSEIESHLNAIPSVRQGAVVAEHDGGRGKRLVAYVVTHDGSGEPAELRRALQSRVPAYMVPSSFVFLDAMPLNASGKLDRKRLAEVAGRRPAERGGADNMSAAERFVASVWNEVLGAKDVNRDSDFFVLGGHSLLAAQVAARIERKLGVAVPLRLMLDLTTVNSFAPAVEFLVAASLFGWQRNNVMESLDAYAAAPAASPLPLYERAGEAGVRQVEGRLESALNASPSNRIPRLRKSEAGLSSAQRRMWFLERVSGQTSLFTVPVAIRFTGELSLDRLRAALANLIERHEALRTAFLESEGEPVQRVCPPVPIPVEVIDCENPAALDERLRAEAWRPLDLASAPHLRAAVLRCESAPSVLLLTLHHIVCDDWSMGVLMRDLLAFYGGQGAHLPPLPIQYTDFAEWEQQQFRRARSASLAWWREYLRGLPEELPMPVDSSAPSSANSGGLRPIAVNPELAAAVDAQSRAARATPYMLLLASFNALLYCLTGASDLVVGSPFANREMPETQNLIGLLLNPLAIRTRLRDDYSFGELLDRVRDSVASVHEHSGVPFEAVLNALENPRARNPFRVWLSVQNAPMPKLELPGVSLEVMLVEPETAKFDLSLLISQQTMSGYFEYRKDLFAASIDSIAEFWLELLRRVTDSPEVRLSDLRAAWLDYVADRERQRESAAMDGFRAAAGRKFEKARASAKVSQGGAA